MGRSQAGHLYSQLQLAAWCTAAKLTLMLLGMISTSSSLCLLCAVAHERIQAALIHSHLYNIIHNKRCNESFHCIITGMHSGCLYARHIQLYVNVACSQACVPVCGICHHLTVLGLCNAPSPGLASMYFACICLLLFTSAGQPGSMCSTHDARPLRQAPHKSKSQVPLKLTRLRMSALLLPPRAVLCIIVYACILMIWPGLWSSRLHHLLHFWSSYTFSRQLVLLRAAEKLWLYMILVQRFWLDQWEFWSCWLDMVT